MRRIVSIVPLCIVGIGTASAQATVNRAKTVLTPASVPFVGCASSGQIETQEAPKGTSRPVPISSTDAYALAYYRSADGLGILAPRGWYCEGVSGSSGEALFVSPQPVRSASTWEGIKGPAVAVYRWSSDGSGRFEVAEILIRVFPDFGAAGRKYFESMDLRVPTGSFPSDTLTRRGRTTVEYTTPAQTDGLGNFHSRLGKNDLPIRGAAILHGNSNSREAPDVTVLSVRVPGPLTRVVPLIIGQFERDEGVPSH
jgi:hypothetical protein